MVQFADIPYVVFILIVISLVCPPSTTASAEAALIHPSVVGQPQSSTRLSHVETGSLSQPDDGEFMILIQTIPLALSCSFAQSL